MSKKQIKKYLEASGLLNGIRSFRRFIKKNRIKLVYRLHGGGGWPLIPLEAFAQSCSLAIETLHTGGYVFGDYLEFGVSRGASLSCMSRALRKAGLRDVRSIGFDSFEGMPDGSENEGWNPGAFSSTLEQTTTYLKRSGANLKTIELVKGWFKDTCTPETAARLNLRRASIVMIDCDIYTASCEALAFCGPLLAERAVLIFDDWGCRSDVGEVGQKEAFEEFLAARPELRAEPLPAYTARARMFLVEKQS